ncbi:MAG: hypothetical protein ACYS8W_17845 [Planctomycetota bacterium]|jgi:hypothetical protein
MKKTALHLFLILILTISCIGIGCSKKHKSSRDDAIGTGTTPIGTGTSTGPTGTGGIADPVIANSYPNSPSLAAAVTDMVNMINAQRSNNLVWDGDIAQVAKNHCGRLINDHVDKYVRIHLGKGPEQRLTDGGVTYSVCDETGCGPIMNDMTAATAFSQLDSGVLTNPAFNRIGIGLNAFSDA